MVKIYSLLRSIQIANSKLCCIVLLIVTVFTNSAFSQSGKELVKVADSLYNAGNESKAKEIYLKAASMGNPDAHYDLAYYYVVTQEESLYHNTEAAKMGHEKALEEVLNELFFRAGNFLKANPELAYKIFKIAKSKNPSMKLTEQDPMIVVIKEAIEPGPFDAKNFIEKYKLKDSEINGDYAVWNLATEASVGGRFGPPNPNLVLQLVSRGGWVPQEVMGAVDDTYANWKENKNVEFKPCDYVTSGYGQGYCAGLDEKQANKEFLIRVDKLTPKLNNHAGKWLGSCYLIASRYIEEKAWKEEGSDGTGYIAWAKESIIVQKTAYLDLVNKINKGEGLDSVVTDSDADKKLNDAYRKVIDQLTKKPIDDIRCPITADNIKQVQRRWIKYRDSSSQLFAEIAPAISIIKWNEWLANIRTKELLEILRYRN